MEPRGYETQTKPRGTIMYINPKWIICDFLRNLLTDPRSTRTYTATSDTFTATAAQTTFTLTPSSGKTVSHITSVTIDGSSTNAKKWRDYYIDFRAQTVTFFSGLSAGEELIVNYKESSVNWIYWDKPVEKITEISFPRLDVQIVAGSGSRLGEFNAPVESAIQFQVDIWCKEKGANQIFTISSRKYTGNDLAEYLAYQVMEAFEDNVDDLHPVLYDYTPTQVPARDLPFNEQYQAHHKEVEFIMKGIKLGRTN